MSTAGGILGGHGLPKSYSSAVAAEPPVLPKIDISFGEIHGMPAAFIKDEDMISLAKPFELTLIGKFWVDRPSIAEIRKFVVKMKFFSFVKVDNHDLRNVVFRFSDERDYMRFFARREYVVFGIQMRVTKWSPFSDVSEELPIRPLWVSFPGLRYQLYHLKTLMDIAAMFGKALCVDSNTARQGTMAKARVLVEVDISVNHPKWIWLGSPEKGAPQAVVIENLPLFCGSCKKIGHDISACARGEVLGEVMIPSAPILQWVPKEKGRGLGVEGHTRGSRKTPLCGEDNYPIIPVDANFSNYSDYATELPESESKKAEGATPSIEVSVPKPGIIEGNSDALPSSSVECAGTVDDDGSPSSPPNNDEGGPDIPQVCITLDKASMEGPRMQPAPSSLMDIINSALHENGNSSENEMGLQNKDMASGCLGESEKSKVDARAVQRWVKESEMDAGLVNSGKSGAKALPEWSPSTGDAEFPPLISIGKGKKLLFSTSLKIGSQPSSPLSPRKTRLQSKLEALGGDQDTWNLSSKGSGQINGPRAVALQALFYPNPS